MASGTKDFWITAETDIVAQTIAKMDVDVVAQSLDRLAVDISSQTLSKLDIDIVSQALTNLSIDINKQSLGQIMQRPKYGAPVEDIESLTISNGNSEIIHNFSGQGKLYCFIMYINGSLSYKDLIIRIYADGRQASAITPKGLYNYRLFSPGDYIIHLPLYNQEDQVCAIATTQDITFESTLTIQGDNTPNSHSVNIESHLLAAMI